MSAIIDFLKRHADGSPRALAVAAMLLCSAAYSVSGVNTIDPGVGGDIVTVR